MSENKFISSSSTLDEVNSMLLDLGGKLNHSCFHEVSHELECSFNNIASWRDDTDLEQYTKEAFEREFEPMRATAISSAAINITMILAALREEVDPSITITELMRAAQFLSTSVFTLDLRSLETNAGTQSDNSPLDNSTI